MQTIFLNGMPCGSYADAFEVAIMVALLTTQYPNSSIVVCHV